MYAALHEGAQPRFSGFRTAPRGSAAFTFTSFGDQGTPTMARTYVPPEGVTLPGPLLVNDNLGSPAAADTSRSVPTTLDTPEPTCSTTSRARATERRPAFDSCTMAAYAWLMALTSSSTYSGSHCRSRVISFTSRTFPSFIQAI